MFERHTRSREPQTMNLFLTRPAWGGALLALAWCAASAAALPAQQARVLEPQHRLPDSILAHDVSPKPNLNPTDP